MAAYGIPNVIPLSESVKLADSQTVSCSGASASLVAADADRKILIISASPNNTSYVSVHFTGGTASLDLGFPLGPGDSISIAGLPAQSAMTQFGASGAKLCITVGKH